MSVTTEMPVRRAGRVGAAVRGLFDLAIGGLLCLSPVTSVIALGWMMRRMAASVDRQSGRITGRSGWVLGPRGRGWPTRLLGGLAANIREGVKAALALMLATVPFSLPWLLAWWAGWDNSFNKGYEQAWAGPVLFLAGIAIFLAVMVHLPMGLARQAATGRWFAALEWREVQIAVRHAGWGHVALAFATVFFALPLFASRALVVFVEDIIPGFDALAAQDVAQVAEISGLVVAVYVFASFWWLRCWAARIYARAMIRAAAQTEASNVQGPGWIGRAARLVSLLVIWFGLVVLIVVGQFVNHSWWAWAQHPAFGLPWFG